MFFSFVIYNKCGHRNVLSKRLVWMSIFHIINFKKNNSGNEKQLKSFIQNVCIIVL